MRASSRQTWRTGRLALGAPGAKQQRVEAFGRAIDVERSGHAARPAPGSRHLGDDAVQQRAARLGMGGGR
jgi:hypothetical protein